MDPNNPNLYVYCANNPLVYIDPTGQWNEESKWWNPFSWFNKSDDGGGGGGGTGGGTGGGGSSSPPKQTVNPSGTNSSNNSTPTTVTVDTNQVVVKDNAGNVVTTYFRDDLKSDLQRLAQLQQNAVSNPTPVNIDAAKNFADKIKKDYKEFFDATKDSQGGVSVIGLRGWGVGTKCYDTDSIKGEKNTYDDMLIVMGTDGAMDVITRCNFEGTTATGTYKGGTLNDKGYPSIADGSYELNAWKHNDNYDNVVLNENGKVLIMGENPQYPGRGNPGYAIGVEFHRGGSDWTWSKGCITIYAPSGDTSRWDRFMSHFPTQPIGTRVGSFNLMTL